MIKLTIFPGNYLPYIGGLETHVDEFAKYPAKTGRYKIIIVAPRYMNAKSFEKKYKNVYIFRYPSLYIIEHFAISKFWSRKFWRIIKKINLEKPDIVMTRTRFFLNTLLGFLYSRFNNIKLIHDIKIIKNIMKLMKILILIL